MLLVYWSEINLMVKSSSALFRRSPWSCMAKSMFRCVLLRCHPRFTQSKCFWAQPCLLKFISSRWKTRTELSRVLTSQSHKHSHDTIKSRKPAGVRRCPLGQKLIIKKRIKTVLQSNFVEILGWDGTDGWDLTWFLAQWVRKTLTKRTSMEHDQQTS